MTGPGTPFELLLTEPRLGGLRLRNRLVCLPQATARASRGIPSDDIACWEVRAAGGATMLVIGGRAW